MKIRLYLTSIIFMTFLSVLYAGPATCENFGPVQNLEVVTRHIPDMVISESKIKMEWEPCEGDPLHYFIQFDTNPEHTFQHPEAWEGDYVRWTRATSPDLSESDPDDVAFYFHVAAGDDTWEISPTTTAGPFRIDTVPPYDLTVTAPEITSSRTITLTLTSTNACLLRISESEYDLRRQLRSDSEITTNWGFLTLLGEHGYDILVSAEECEQSGCNGVRTDIREWELSQGGGEKTVYVGFYDLAWNPAKASVVITFVAGDADGDLLLSLRDAVLVMQVLAGTAIHAANPDADVNGDQRIGTEEMVFILKEISGTE